MKLSVFARTIVCFVLIPACVHAARTSSVNGAKAPAGNTLNLSLVEVASGFSRPLELMYSAPGDDRLFIVERAGEIHILESDGSVLPTPFLDISGRVETGSHPAEERGLLGMAFHPNYATNGKFYLQYTHRSGSCSRTRISQFLVTANPDIADANSEEIILNVGQPTDNHNGGGIYFSPIDGYLYIPLGDGGGSGDNSGDGNNAQRSDRLLGKISRIDVDQGAGSVPDCNVLSVTSSASDDCDVIPNDASGNYTVPSSNPFTDGAGGVCDEIWAFGTRNPYHCGFDRQTGDLYIGDVGQGWIEETNFQPAGSGGQNYGWRCYEGTADYSASGSSCSDNVSPIPTAQFTFPIFEVEHTGSDCSVIGGRVYRGTLYPEMVGKYFTADYCSGYLYVLWPDGTGGWNSETYPSFAGFGTSAISDGADGEIYFVNVSNGRVYHLEEDTVNTDDIFVDSFE